MLLTLLLWLGHSPVSDGRSVPFSRIPTQSAEFLRAMAMRPECLLFVRSSRCQRDAAIMAASEAGFRDKVCSFYRAMGYRWYHILPDRVVADPMYLLHPNFLRTTFSPAQNKRQAGLKVIHHTIELFVLARKKADSPKPIRP